MSTERIEHLWRECPECGELVEVTEAVCLFCGCELEELEDADFEMGAGITIVETDDGSVFPF